MGELRCLLERQGLGRKENNVFMKKASLSFMIEEHKDLQGL